MKKKRPNTESVASNNPMTAADEFLRWFQRQPPETQADPQLQIVKERFDKIQKV